MRGWEIGAQLELLSGDDDLVNCEQEDEDDEETDDLANS